MIINPFLNFRNVSKADCLKQLRHVGACISWHFQFYFQNYVERKQSLHRFW